MLADAMARAHGAADASAYASTAFMIWQLGEATMRLAVSVDEKEGATIVAAFRRMTLREILAPGRCNFRDRRRPRLHLEALRVEESTMQAGSLRSPGEHKAAMRYSEFSFLPASPDGIRIRHV